MVRERNRTELPAGNNPKDKNLLPHIPPNPPEFQVLLQFCQIRDTQNSKIAPQNPSPGSAGKGEQLEGMRGTAGISRQGLC